MCFLLFTTEGERRIFMGTIKSKKKNIYIEIQMEISIASAFLRLNSKK